MYDSFIWVELVPLLFSTPWYPSILDLCTMTSNESELFYQSIFDAVQVSTIGRTMSEKSTTGSSLDGFLHVAEKGTNRNLEGILYS